MKNTLFSFFSITLIFATSLIACKSDSKEFKPLIEIKQELENYKNLKLLAKDAPIDDATDWTYNEADSLMKTLNLNDSAQVNNNLMKIYYAESLYFFGILYIPAVYNSQLIKLNELLIQFDNTADYQIYDLQQAKLKIEKLNKMYKRLY